MTDEKLKRLKPSEVTEDGFYWLCERDAAESSEVFEVVKIFPDMCIYFPGYDSPLPMQELDNNQDYLIGPLTPPEDE